MFSEPPPFTSFVFNNKQMLGKKKKNSDKRDFFALRMEMIVNFE